jgi:HAD superfamily hydrolase (TIGR01458 family)
MSERAARAPIDGLLLDMDGVLTVSWKPIDGAVETLSLLRRRDVPVRVMTNTTSHSRAALSDQLRGAGFDVAPEEILTAPVATASYLRAHHPGARVYLLGETGVAQDLDGVTLIDKEPADVVVVGGADEAFTFHNMNTAFRMLLNGAALVAMHRNFSWLTDEGLCLDAGAYLVGLEAATGLSAAVTGKPSPDFFGSGLDALGLPAERVAMVGDDLASDVLAAQALGMTGVLTRTGKFRQEELDHSTGRPDHVVDSIADLPELLGLA